MNGNQHRFSYRYKPEFHLWKSSGGIFGENNHVHKASAICVTKIISRLQLLAGVCLRLNRKLPKVEEILNVGEWMTNIKIKSDNDATFQRVSDDTK